MYCSELRKNRFLFVFLTIQNSAEYAEYFKQEMYARLKPLYDEEVIERGITHLGKYFILFRVKSDFHDFSKAELSDFGEVILDRNLIGLLGNKNDLITKIQKGEI